MGGSPQTIESGYTPSAGEVPLINDATQQAYSLFNNPQAMYPGQTFVGASPYTQAGIHGLAGTAGQQQQMGQDFYNSWNRGLNASDVANNQQVQDQLTANASQVNDNLQRNIMPGIQQGAIQGGGMNSARQGIAQGVAAGDASEALSNANASTMLNAYGQGLQHEQGMMGQTGNLNTALTNPWSSLASAGQGVEGYQNMALQDAMTRYGYGNEQANSMLDKLIGRFGQMKYGTQSQTNPNYEDPFTSIAKLGAGGASMASGMGWSPLGGGGKSPQTG